MSSEPPSDRPRRTHPTSLLFIALATARQNLVPALIAGYGAIEGSAFGIMIAGGIVGAVALFAVVRYLTLRYRIANGELVVSEGLISRKVRTVPIDRIQNVDLLQNVFHRLLGVAEVRVETASGTEPEAILRVLSMTDVERLRREIFRNRRAADAGPTPEAISEPGTVVQQSVTLLQIPTVWLVKAGLASNKGMILVGVILGVVFQPDWHDRLDLDQIADNLPQQAPLLGGWVLLPAGIVAALILIRILGVGWYVLRFHGYRLERVGEDFHLSCGLLTKVSATVPRRRIQFISVHRTPLLRWMNMASIRIETAGGAGKENEDAAATVTRRWFVPIIPDALVSGLINQLRAGFVFDESTVPWQSVSPRAGRRLIKLCVIAAIIAAIVGFATVQPWGWLCGVVCLPLFVLWSRRHLKILAYARVEDGFMFRSGVWTLKTSVTFFDRIQALTLKESLFDRRWGMATLSIDTAAAGPADHAIEVAMLEAPQATAELESLSEQSAKIDMVWN